MSSVRDTSLSRPSLPTIPGHSEPTTGTTGTTSTTKTSGTTPTGPVDGTDKVDASAVDQRRTTGAITGLLTPPTVGAAANTRLENVSSAALSFSMQLNDLGAAKPSSEAMMLAFIKLQFLDASQGNDFNGFANAFKSDLLGGALNAQKRLTSEVNAGQSQTTQANNLDAQADVEAATAQQILANEGVNAQEVRGMGEQLYAEGKTGSEDLVARYQQAHPDATPEQLDAIREAYPHMVNAAMADAQAGQIHGVQGNNYGNLLLAHYATKSVRAGSNGYGAFLRQQEENQKSANELLSLLSGTRADQKGRDEAMVELDESRLEVSQLILNLIDKTSASSGQRRGSLLG